MKKVLFGMLLLTTIFLSGCTDTTKTPQDSSAKTKPVYQGMEISKESGTLYFPTTIQPTRLSSVFLTTSDEEPVDEEIIIEETEDSFGVLTSEEVSLYAQKNETLFITVNILNPDSFEILSFTLNGYKYQSYQFEDGSDSEQLILEVNSGDISGIKEFTIDQIKYVDGTDINDVTIDGDETVLLGVQYDTTPVAIISNENIGTTFISFDINLIDEYGLIALTDNNAKAVLYDGEDIIQEVDLVIGDNEVLFDNLSSVNNYQYAVVATFDLMDSNGTIIDVLDSNAFTTNNFIEISNVVPQQETITFELDITDTDTVGSLTSIELYQGETLIETLIDLTVREFTGLLSNNEFTIKATYTYDLNDGVGDQTDVIINEIGTTLFDGFGTEESPYIIRDYVDFNNIRFQSDKFYILEQNINMADKNWVSISVFSGVLDGNGHSISNISYSFTMDDDISEFYTGLVSLNTGTIKNLDIINVNLQFNTLNEISLGVIATRNSGTIDNVYIELYVDATTYGSATIGGVSMYNSGVITNSNSNVTMIVNAGSMVNIAGISAQNYNGTIKQSYSLVDLDGTAASGNCYVGGIAGITSRGKIYDSYSTGNLVSVCSDSQYSHVGGITAKIDNGEIKNTFFHGDVYTYSGGYRANAGGIVGHTWGSDILMQNNISFANVWSDGDGVFRAGGITGNIRGTNIVTYNNFVDTSYEFKNTYGSLQDSVDLDYLGINELNVVANEDFFVNTLGWSRDIWDFTNLDIANGNYPTLKE